MDFKKLKNELLFVPLGGANEIGMNLNLYHLDGKWLMVDCGIGFADDYLPGVDVILPNIDFIIEHRHDLLGLIVTHAHEDHLGGVPYLWEELRCPVYATPFCANLLREKMKSAQLTGIPITEVQDAKDYEFGPFNVEFVGITHSIPEMKALAIKTRHGTVMHTGDWKIDPDPLVGEATDSKRLKELGDEGILAMTCDSTNVFVPGQSGSEAGVREGLIEAIKSCKYRVGVTTFASNVARLESILYAAQACNRKVSLVGRSLWRILAAAQDAGYLQDIPEIVEDRTAMGYPRDEVLFICTGSQGEALAATSKIANREHPAVKFAPGDTFIFSSRMIPGNEKKISWIQNRMVQNGIEILSNDYHVHVSGHPARDELKQMYEWVRPKISIPVHGEARHIREHARFAKSLGVEEAIEPENGIVIQLSGDAGIVGSVKTGYLAVEGDTIIPSDSVVIRTRRKLRDGGAVLVTLALGKQGELMFDPIITAPGALDSEADQDLIQLLQDEVVDAITTRKSKKAATDNEMKDITRSAVRRIMKSELNKKPVVEVHLVRTA